MVQKDSFAPVLEALQDLYSQIEKWVAPLLVAHKDRLVCKQGCCACCVDDMTVSEVEALNIQQTQAVLLQQGAPHDSGACAFLDKEGSCRIYEQRPYVCRTQGLPLRWLEEQDSGDIVEVRDICPLNENHQPIEDLPSEQCWPIGPVEEALAQLQERLRPGEMRRVPLRSLFGSG